MAVTPHELVLEAKSQVKEVSTADGQSLLGKRVVIDVREYDEFAAGHLPGAINIPRGVLEFKIGYSNVISMVGGFEAWNNQGRPTETPQPINFE